MERNVKTVGSPSRIFLWIYLLLYELIEKKEILENLGKFWGKEIVQS